MTRARMIKLCLVLLSLLPAVPAHAQIFKEPEGSHLDLRIPVAVSWWTPVDGEWRDVLTGIAGLRAGAELYPVGEGKTPEDGILRPYGRAMLSWRIGAGSPSTYGAVYNILGIQAGLFARMNITGRHGVYLGVGPMWAVELYSFQPKYGDGETVPRWGTAAFVTAGYQFKASKRLSIFAECEYELFLAGNLLDTAVVSAGVTVAL